MEAKIEQTNFKQVVEFHTLFGGVPECLMERFKLRERLVSEEYKETLEAMENLKNDPQNIKLKAELLKELVDLLYVTYGTIHSFGWDADAAFCEVQRSNMSKVGEDGKPLYREDGKILKGPNYSPANMEGFVK